MPIVGPPRRCRMDILPGARSAYSVFDRDLGGGETPNALKGRHAGEGYGNSIPP